MRPGNVLMVCLGNICRSPLAHGIFQSLLDDPSILVDSAGTANYHTGAPPDPRSIAIAKKNNIEIANQQARQFIIQDFEKFDHIFVMDKQNLENVLKLARSSKDSQKVSLLLNNQEVDDPYYDGSDGFDTTFNVIYNACERILSEWKK